MDSSVSDGLGTSCLCGRGQRKGRPVDRLKREPIESYRLHYLLALAGLAGIVQASYLSSVTASLATGQELSVIAATVIGGVNLAGGEGTVFGVIIGTVMLEILRNGLLLFGIDPYWQGVFVGAIIIIAVSIDRFRQATHEGLGRLRFRFE